MQKLSQTDLQKIIDSDLSDSFNALLSKIVESGLEVESCTFNINNYLETYKIRKNNILNAKQEMMGLSSLLLKLSNMPNQELLVYCYEDGNYHCHIVLNSDAFLIGGFVLLKK